ncbi:MAG: fibrobacter succinogenes major paralogous domain-containing protein [Fibrobacter sp.]|nr:fibrobacter succinogenes major paralogous domain-containing protein [Fibrobacter sp.]
MRNVFASTKCVAISLMLGVFLVACGDDNSSSAAPDGDEPSSSSVILRSDTNSSSSVKSSSSAKLPKSSSSSAGKVKSSSSANSSSSAESSSSEKDKSSSSSAGKEKSSVTVISGADLKFSSSIESSSSSAGEVNCSALLEEERENGEWSWDVPKECRFNPDIDYGTMTDERDGKVYKTVKIGYQVWMAENLNFDVGQGGSGENVYEWSWCYNNEPKNCEVAGRIYTWAAAIDSVKLATDADDPQECGFGKICGLASASSATLVQGVCPTGWHLPSNTEWNILFTKVGGKSNAGKVLKAQTGWIAYSGVINEDAVGFTALPAVNGGYRQTGISAVFWSSTENNSDRAYYISLYCGDDEVILTHNPKNKDYSVRCVKNN